MITWIVKKRLPYCGTRSRSICIRSAVQLDTLAALASGLGVSVRQLLDPPADSAAVSHFIETEGKELILSALSSLPTDEQDFLCRLAEEYVRHYHETHPTSVYDPNE